MLEVPFKELSIEARSEVELLDIEPLDFRPARVRSTLPLVWMPWQRQILQPFLLPPELPESELSELTEYAMSFAQRNDYELLDTLLDLNAKARMAGFTTMMYAMVKKVVAPPSTSAGTVVRGRSRPNQRSSARAITGTAYRAGRRKYLPSYGARGLAATTVTHFLRVLGVDPTPRMRVHLGLVPHDKFFIVTGSQEFDQLESAGADFERRGGGVDLGGTILAVAVLAGVLLGAAPSVRRRRRHRKTAAPLAALVVAIAAGAARSDVFSPGPLSQAHATLEGLKNCTQCHVVGNRLSNDTCLACHTELKDRVAEHRGFHGRLAPAELVCNKCHHEHQGRDAQLTQWGTGGQKAFDHRKTGFPLLGKHKKVACDQCHNDRLIADAAIRAMRAKEPQRTTFLGAAVRCVDCHFDEHRGQFKKRCQDCHTESGWKPAPGFKHAKTDFPLLGKHARVQCLKCHARTMDADAHKDAPVRPLSEVFSRFRPVTHASCEVCHKDPHQGKLGADCAACHVESSWSVMKAGKGERAFHEKTRYPLRGAHAEVACKSCHEPFPGVKAVFKGMRFQNCTDCHVDAHLGQLGTPPSACDSCHTVQAFLPARYEPERHNRYPLLGAHLVVACSSCHGQDPGLSAKAVPVRAFVEKRGRSDRVSLTQFYPKGDAQRCDTCHSDPHRGQFAARVKKAGCADCHLVESFAHVRFDHDRESSYPLTGAHQKVACVACHFADSSGAVRYKPLQTQCAACHADPHAGQFAVRPAAATDCAHCHSTANWKETAFVHQPPWTAFELQGKHATTACADCHREVILAGNLKVTQYRGLPTTCAGCHVDVHRGAFREFVP
jgi:hypothetical protein